MTGRAIVIGAGIAGSLASRALARSFDEVLVLERDPDLDGGSARKGVPQGPHIHVLVQGGRDAIRDLLGGYPPGFAGSVETRPTRDLKWFQFGVWKTRFDTDLIARWCDRPRFEAELRREITSGVRVQVLVGHRAQGLVAGHGAVSGVRVLDASGREATLPADLVIDASGAGSRMPDWLRELGFGEVREDQIRVDVCYATRVCRRPPAMGRDWQALAVYPKPPESRRAGIIAPLDDERCLVGLIGWAGDHPPADDAGFLAFARSLPRPDVADALDGLEPLSPIHRYRFPASRWRRFEQLRGWPEGLIAVGDAICRFNPVYGQGMSVAAFDARTLARADWPRPGATRRVQQALARHRVAPWLLASSMDFRFPGVEGQRPFGLGALNAYARGILELSAERQDVNLRFLEVIGLLRPPSALFAPSVALQVARWALTGR
jgi:flavin-dependent dehydrogenase